MTHSYVRHDSFICVTWLIHMCDMTHSYVWHDSFICVTWLIHLCHDSFICLTWLVDMCNVTDLRLHLFAKEPLIIELFCGKRYMKIRHPMTLRHPVCVTWAIGDANVGLFWENVGLFWENVSDVYVWHDSYMLLKLVCVWDTWLIHVCDMTHWFVRRDLFICVTWLFQMCDSTFVCCSNWCVCGTQDLTRSHVWCDYFIHVTWLIALVCVCVSFWRLQGSVEQILGSFEKL